MSEEGIDEVDRILVSSLTCLASPIVKKPIVVGTQIYTLNVQAQHSNSSPRTMCFTFSPKTNGKSLAKDIKANLLRRNYFGWEHTQVWV